MEILLGLVVLLGGLILGVRHGGIGLAVINGIAVVIFTFVFGYKPGKPPIDVMLIIMAVVTCAGTLQTAGGLNVMLKYAEKFLRSNPKRITIYAPITTWLLTVLCGTGHVVYTIMPIIYDIAIKQGIRPERPMAVASVSSQVGITASPVSVAVVSIVGFLVASGYDCTVGNVLMISIPATFCGVLAAAIWSYRRGKDLEKDERFQKFISDPENKAYVYGETATLANQELSKYAYRAVYIFFAGILAITCLGNMPSLLPHFAANANSPAKPISMVLVIQMVMMMVGAFILIGSKVKAKDIPNSNVFKAGMIALVTVYGVAWAADTYFAHHMPVIKEVLGGAVQEYPWAYGVVLFTASVLINSQGAAIAIVTPMALGIGADPVIILSFISAAYGYFFLPNYPSDLATIGFDRAGTTKIGGLILNHSFMIPGLIAVVVGCAVGYTLAHIIL